MSWETLATAVAAAINAAAQRLINKILQKGYAAMVLMVVFVVALASGYFLFGNVPFAKLIIFAGIVSIVSAILEALSAHFKDKEKEKTVNALLEEKEKEIASLKERMEALEAQSELRQKTCKRDIERCRERAFLYIRQLANYLVSLFPSVFLGVANNPKIGSVEVYAIQKDNATKIVIVPKDTPKADISLFMETFWDILSKPISGTRDEIIKTIESL